MQQIDGSLRAVMEQLRVQAETSGLPDLPTAEPLCPLCRGYGMVVSETEWPKTVECPCGIQNERRIARWKQTLPPRLAGVSFETFPVKTPAMRETLAAVRSWSTNGEGSLLLFGENGRGKTSLAISAMRERVEQQGKSALFIRTNDLFREIRKTYDERVGNKLHESDIYQIVFACGLLVLDDVGSERPTEWVQDGWDYLISHRHADELPTIFTTNLDWDTLFARLGDRVGWRIREMCWPNVLHVDGPNLRP